ncbi:BAQ_1a_G0020520.mRNA.1.CDS.1 [Saccharomyces cerevisiae]|nr:BAQ_1a_G0020520.mRNA.1.CDS.1 [Saccharomyces cerevisiae]CAI4493033.1 BAM_G0017680.mRNA.1.CDS.1 [Saccharomyces cerevisiae]CAI7121006.1 BAM_G0017680.mRNA.1.CDS.1 [Saccharomyces cerevisiae]CAI7122511.1 BAQ_1a_G0020520.mRNA.1.CDS.1 [Saccharomyces cerevisiae]
MSSQFFLKTSQDIELFQSYPTFEQSNTNSKDFPVISSVLSPCGRFLALSTKENVKVFTGPCLDNVLLTMKLSDVYDLHFSPAGNYLSTWERASIQDPNHKNVKVWYLNKPFKKDCVSEDIVPAYEYQAKSQSGWFLQFSKLDNYALRLFKHDLKIVKLSSANADNFDFQSPFAVLSDDETSQHFTTYLISPAEHPTICTFTPEKGGKPAQLIIWALSEGKITKKIASKTFFKADSCQLKWNPLGNAILCLAITDFDSSNKSYYGENTLYLLSFQGVNGTLGGNSVRVSLTTGPVHDFTWSPTSRQFGVIAGYMPATISFFDLRGNVVHSLPQQAKNTMLFSPSGHYILIAGFGNLQGSVEILDRLDKFKCVSKFDATNTSVCKWSPGGEFIMTATTSPRLRVDNGVKIWHVSGSLVFVKEFKELLKVDWRSPCNYKTLENKDEAFFENHIINNWEPLPDSTTSSLDPKISNKSELQIHSSVQEYISQHPSREASSNGNGSKAKAGGAYKPPHARRTGGGRIVPGVPPGAAKKSIPGLVPGMSANKDANTKNRRRRANKKSSETSPDSTPAPSAPAPTNAPTNNKETSPEEKKIRSLLKKLRAIETLKERQAVGDKLEDTQVLKIQTEEKVLKDLEKLGWKDE